MELEQKPFALEALAQKMRDLFQKNIEAKGVAFSVEMRDFDAHAWAEAYMDGIGWIPVDFTPGFYYNTYALLRMAELPQKTAGAETADCVSLYRHFTWKRYAAALKSDRRTHHGKNHEFYHQSSRASAWHLCVTEGQSRRQHDHHLRYSYDKTEF